ncbi:transposase [Streptomyces scopuliridis]|uniref:transposase n=1 Tax=Streptomyces scopuliridis TaxID=452529 RepID=UPI0036930BD5
MTSRTVKRYADARQAGRPLHRSVADPDLSPRRVQDPPRRPLERGPHQRLETVGRDRPARLQGQLPARSRVPPPETHLATARDRPAASPRAVAGWVLRRPETLSESEYLHLKNVRANCPETDALTRHVRSFATMLTERQGERLPDWLAAVRKDDLPSLHTLAAGIDRDREAVIAGLTLPWNSGVVGGHVNRIKMLKRQMFGRAGFALLRKRVLLAP